MFSRFQKKEYFWISVSIIGLYLILGDCRSLIWIQQPEYQQTMQQYEKIRWVVYQVQKQTVRTQIQLTDDSNNADLWRKLSKLLELQGKTELSKQAKSRAIALEPLDKNIKN